MLSLSAPRSWAPWGVGLVALVITAWNSWVPGMWYDEIATLTAVKRSWPSLADLLRDEDVVHATYYSLMHLWMDVVPYSPFTLRLPSVVAVALTAVVLVKIAELQWGLIPGVVAGLTFVAIPRAQWMALEARSFALATFAITLAVYLFIRAVKGGRRRHWVIYGAALAVAICLFIYNALVVPVLVVVALVSHLSRNQRLHFWLSTLAAVVVASPVVLIAISQRGQVAWIGKVTLESAIAAPRAAFLLDVSNDVVAAGWAVFFGVCALLMVARQGRASGGPLSPGGSLVLVGGWLTVPMLTLLAVGAFLPVYYQYYMCPLVPALALVAGGGVASLGSKVWQALIALVVVAVLAYEPWILVRQPNSRTNILDVVATVEQRSHPGDAVLFVDTGEDGGGWDTRQLSYAYPQAFVGLKDLTIDKPYEVSGEFFATYRDLEEVTPELAGVTRVIAVVNSPDLPESNLASDSAILQGEGFRLVSQDRIENGELEAEDEYWLVLVFER